MKALRDTAVYLTGWSRRDVYGVGISLAPDLIMNRLRARITDVVTTMQAAVAANFERHGVELVHGTASVYQHDRALEPACRAAREVDDPMLNDDDNPDARLAAPKASRSRFGEVV